jgi:hypothetical protein
MEHILNWIRCNRSAHGGFAANAAVKQGKYKYQQHNFLIKSLNPELSIKLAP